MTAPISIDKLYEDAHIWLGSVILKVDPLNREFLFMYGDFDHCGDVGFAFGGRVAVWVRTSYNGDERTVGHWDSLPLASEVVTPEALARLDELRGAEEDAHRRFVEYYRSR